MKQGELPVFAKVIVGFDGGEEGRDALALSRGLTALDGELVVCCVHRLDGLSSRVDPLEPRLDRASAERCVGAACSLLEGPRTITPLLIASADAALALHTTASQRGSELLVLGSSHRGPVGRVLVGSVTEETLHGAPCPVAVAPVGFHRTSSTAPLARIAVGYDVVNPSLQALDAAATLASQTGAELQLIAVADTAAARAGGASAAMSYPAIVKARLDEAHAGLARALGALPAGIAAAGVVRDGIASEELLEVTHSVDLLVLGSRGRGPLGRLLLGSVCDTIVRAAACPVLVIPPASNADERARPTSVPDVHTPTFTL